MEWSGLLSHLLPFLIHPMSGFVCMTYVRVLNVFVGQGLLGRLCLVEAGFRVSDLMDEF